MSDETSTSDIVDMYEKADSLEQQAVDHLKRAKTAEATARQERRQATVARTRATELRLMAAGTAMERSGVDIDRREAVLARISADAQQDAPPPSYAPNSNEYVG